MPQTREKIKICLVLHAPLGGGAEKVMIEIARHLSRDVFDVKLILLAARGEYDHLLPEDISVIDLGVKLPGQYQLTDFRSIWKLSRVLKEIDPQLIFSTLGYTNLMTIIAKLLSGIRSKLIIRETTVLSVYLRTDKLSFFKRTLYKKFYPYADAVVGPSRAVIEDLEGFIPSLKRRPRHVIANFINPRDIESGLSREWTPGARGLKTDRPVIISVGHLEKVKGVDLGLRAFAELNRIRPAYYWILGSGTQEQGLGKLSAQLGIENSVWFLGFQKNPYIFLKNATIFFLPSRFEGFPNALLEAMYIGLPSVVTRYNNSITDFINDGEEGLIVDPNDAMAMATALERLFNDNFLRENMGVKAREKANGFDIRNLMVRYEQLFVGVVEK